MSHSAAQTSSKLSFFEYFITYAFYPLQLATTLGLYLVESKHDAVA